MTVGGEHGAAPLRRIPSKKVGSDRQPRPTSKARALLASTLSAAYVTGPATAVMGGS